MINASLYGIIKEAAAHCDKAGHVYGMINGIEGFLSGHVMDLSAELSDEDLELLRLTPAAYLGSCRYKLPENLDASVYTLLFEKFEQLNIGAVFYIGGMIPWILLTSFPAGQPITIKTFLYWCP